MFDQEHVDRLLGDIASWNEWRSANPDIIPRLAEANLSSSHLAKANLSNARLHGANLNQAILNGANLEGARLGEASLRSAKLTGAMLIGADLTDANLKGASLFQAWLDEARLSGANLERANLGRASMRHALLDNANLSGVSTPGLQYFGEDCYEGQLRLDGASLCGANLSGADLRAAVFEGADLTGANLSECTLDRANLRGARLDRAILIHTNLDHADMTGASIYGVSAWSLQTRGTKQLDLIVQRSKTDTPFMVDDIEVAQFLYMMLDNQRIRNVIDTITSKMVLILGRFGPERKAILDGLRFELGLHNYMPVIFDFEKPDNRDLTETVRTLAHMARFVIADLTDAKSLPQELETIIPGLPSLPIQPIILSGSPEYAMFEHFERYAWVLPVVEYPSLDVLLGAIQPSIIDPAERKAQEQAHHAIVRRERVVLQPVD